MAAKADKQKSKTKSAKSGKGGKDATPTVERGIEAVSVASHPRTAAYVRAAKGWSGLGGFAIALLLSLQASVPVAQSLERALLFGVIGFVIGWAISVTVCRQIVIAEMRAIREQLENPPGDITAQPTAKSPAAKRERRETARSGAASR